MHYIESGSGPPLILLHAFPVDARLFNDVRALLDTHARVITPDQRGLGESPLDGSSTQDEGDVPPPVPAPGQDVLAADVLELADRLGLGRFLLGGCSMGGYTTMAVLRAAPERVRGVLLIDTKAAADTTEQHDNRIALAERVSGQGTTGWFAENNLPNLLGETTRTHRPEVVGRARELIDAQPATGVAWTARAIARRPDSADVLREWDGPALAIGGDEDSLTPPEVVREVAALMPHGESTILPGAGHLSPLETPRAFADAVAPWLARFE